MDRIADGDDNDGREEGKPGRYDNDEMKHDDSGEASKKPSYLHTTRVSPDDRVKSGQHGMGSETMPA
eukprot:2157729-Pyramimonas_sp.AAC.2